MPKLGKYRPDSRKFLREQAKRQRRMQKLAEKGRLLGKQTKQFVIPGEKKQKLALKRIGHSNWWPDLTEKIIKEMRSRGNTLVKTSLYIVDHSRTTEETIVFDVSTGGMLGERKYFGTFMVDWKNLTIRRL